MQSWACRSSITQRARPTTATGPPRSHAPPSSSCTASASTPASTTDTASRSTRPASTCGRSTSSATGSALALAVTSARIADSSDLADALTEIAEGERPGLPLIAQGHSFGAVVTLSRLLDQPDRYRAGVDLRRPAGPDPGDARLGQLIRPRPALAVRRSVLPRFARERPAGVRRRRRCAVGPGARHRMGPVRQRPAGTDGAHACRARRRRSRSRRSARCRPTPSR